MYSPRGTFRLWPEMTAAANKVAAPIPEPATRRLQGDTSRSAIAAAIQLRPQANASSTTSSLAVAAASPFVSGSDITEEVRRKSRRVCLRKRYNADARVARRFHAWRYFRQRAC